MVWDGIEDDAADKIQAHPPSWVKSATKLVLAVAACGAVAAFYRGSIEARMEPWFWSCAAIMALITVRRWPSWLIAALRRISYACIELESVILVFTHSFSTAWATTMEHFRERARAESYNRGIPQ